MLSSVALDRPGIFERLAIPVNFINTPLQTMSDLYLQVDTFKNLLVDIARSGARSDDEFKTQRAAIIEISELKDLISIL
jgi:hypothetical protein